MEETKVIIDENPNDGNPSVIDPAISKGEYPTLVDLSEKEQKSSAAWKWAISENKRLQEYETKYYSIKTSFYAVHEEFEVFKAKNSNNPILE